MQIHKRGDGDAQETAPLEEQKPKTKKQSQESVIVYVTILFTVAFLLVLLSYFMQQRKNEDALSDLTEAHSQFTIQAQQNIENLQNNNIELQNELNSAKEEIEKLEDEKASLTEENDDLKSQLEEAKTLEETLRNSRSAIEDLFSLLDAIRNDDVEADVRAENIKTAFNKMNSTCQYLDGAYTEMYEGILTQPELYDIDSELTEEPLAVWRETHPEINE